MQVGKRPKEHPEHGKSPTPMPKIQSRKKCNSPGPNTSEVKRGTKGK